jgi:hypothetical protein
VAALYTIGALNASVVWFSHDVYHLIAGVAPEPSYRERDSAVDDNAAADEHDHHHDHAHGDDHGRNRSGVHSHRHAGDAIDHSHATIVDLLLAAKKGHGNADEDNGAVINAYGLDLHLNWVVRSGNTPTLASLGPRTTVERCASQFVCPDTPPPQA